MSGLVGLFRRDGSTVQDAEIYRMVSAMIHRGPDRQDSVCLGPAALGQAMLWTTPESLHEHLPAVHHPSGLAITADARIDNRDELMEALRIARPANTVSDSDLILEAYRKWGHDCPEKLAGDFAFAIWDAKAQQLFCARDPMGIRGLYYYASPNLFAFASEIKSLCSLPDIPARLNEMRVLDYAGNIFDDRTITFYKDILRLPAGSFLLVGRTGLRVSHYWKLDPSHELKLKSDEEYTEAFRECFTECVRARMRSAFPIGSALSGGLDSSSVACVTRKHLPDAQKLHTFSLIFPSFPEKILRHIDERKYIHDVLEQGGFEPHFVLADQLSPLGKVREVHRHLDEAFFEGNLYLHWAMYETAQKNGVRVFLDGLDGDTTISHGFEYLADLVRQLKWRTLAKERRMLAANLGLSPKQVLRDYCIKPFCPTWVFTAWRRLHGRRSEAGILHSFLSDGFKQRQGFDERVRSLIRSKRSCLRNAREKHWEMINFPLYQYALEVADKSSAAFQVEARYPFFDRRLIELCLSLPARLKLGQGWTRLILRRAMEGILPESIRWRPNKANLSPNFFYRLVDRDQQMLKSVILEDPSEIEPYLDIPSLRQAYQAYNQNPVARQEDSMTIFSAVNLAIWLRTAGVRP
jgi:asparagine synthase (glutamine-hydrolysing)